MTTGVACPVPIMRFCDNAGNPAVGGSVLTQVGGVNTATYADVNLTQTLPNPIPLNSRGEIATAAGTSAQLFLTPNTAYSFTLYDANGNQLWVATYVNGVQVSITQTLIGQTLWPQTTEESSLAVTPTNYFYPSDIGLARSRRYSSTNTWDYRYDQRLFEIYLSKYGAVFNGTTDDTAAIADSINAMQALATSGPRRVIMPSGGLTAKIGTAGALTFYCGAVGVDFNGMILDASSITSGNVVTVTGRGSSPNSRYASSAAIENFNLVGSTNAANTPVMLYINGGAPASGEVSNGFLRNFSVYGGSVGIDMAANVYIMAFVNADILAQTLYGVRFTGGATTGENIAFFGGSISGVINPSNTGVGLYLTTGAADADFNFFGTSFDYCNQLINMQSGRLTLNGCHLESEAYGTTTMINVQQAAATSFKSAFRMLGGILYIAGTTAPSAIIETSGGSATSIELDATIENPNSLASQLFWVTDASQVPIKMGSSSLQYVNYPVLQGPLNQTYNGGFELGNLNGWTTTGTSYTWTADSANPHAGTYAMKCVSTGGATGSAIQLIPVKSGQRVYVDCWVDVTAVSAGTFGMYAKFFQDSAGANQVGTGFTVISEGATTTGYVEATASGSVPQGANYMQLEVIGSAFTGTAYVDDIMLGIF